jgi:hypothetical protein
MSTRLTPVAIALLFVVVGCASSSSSHAATRLLPVVQVGDGRDGGSVSLHVGQRLRVVLHSTYWEFKPVSNTTVLRSVAEPSVAPKSGCVPGQGCGTVTAVYVARHAGTAVVKAARTSCGEAMGCTGDAGSYTVTVVVSRGTR